MTQTLKSICVFCGSSFGVNPEYQKNAQSLGEYLAQENIQLVFGGSNVGLMGEIAKTVMDKGGRAIGIIPQKIFENVSHIELTETHVVQTMHERKAMMHSLADGFIALPGGIGTLEELAETMTWSQIGYHQKPVGLLNINHFYDPFIELLQHMGREGFYDERYLQNLVVESSPKELVESLKKNDRPIISKWD